MTECVTFYYKIYDNNKLNKNSNWKGFWTSVHILRSGTYTVHMHL